MTCGDFQVFLLPYVDGEFAPEDALSLEEHLAGCTPCTERVQRETRSRTCVRALLRSTQVAAPAAFRASVHSMVAREDRRQALSHWARWGTFALLLAGASGASYRIVFDEAPESTAPGIPPPRATLQSWYAGKQVGTQRLLLVPEAPAGPLNATSAAWFDADVAER